jgi:hypothetical protein
MTRIAIRGAASVLWCSLAVWPSASLSVAAREPAAPRIAVTVDPRVELMCIIFRLAGSPEYNQGRVPSYVQDVDSHFGKFRDHPVVALARKLGETQEIGYDAVMGIAVHVTDAFSLQEAVPLSPQPNSLDPRWTPESAREFLALARQFVVDTRFKEFLDQHQPLYQVGIQRMQQTLDKYAHLEWFEKFFGPRQSADFHVVLGLLNGGGSYGVHLTKPDGREELYCIIGVWMVDFQGQPAFSASFVPTIVHEFTHSYTNAFVDQFAKELQGPGEKIYPFVADEMQRQAYAGWKTLMYESLNRACVLRYVLATEGPAATQRAAAREKSRGFYWVPDLAELLGEYDAQPRRYVDLTQFSPKIIAFFNDYAKEADTKLGALKAEKEKRLWPKIVAFFERCARDADTKSAALQADKERQLQEWRDKGPKIVTMVPANGAEDVDPNLRAIVVTFDRPMRDRSWAVVTFSEDQFPKIAGPASYNATRKVFTAPVELQGGKEYVFGLNAERFLGFYSEEGIPLAPVVVRFRTRPATK